MGGPATWHLWLTSLAVLLASPSVFCHFEEQFQFREEMLAAPVFQPSPTVQVLVSYAANLAAQQCTASVPGGVAKTVAMGTKFQLPEAGRCVWFKCKTNGVNLARSKTGCHYGNECLDQSPGSEGRQYTCVKNFQPMGDTQWSWDSTTFNRTKQLLVGFAATPTWSIQYVLDPVNGTCTLGHMKVKVGGKVDTSGTCLTLDCTQRGVVLRAGQSDGCMGPDGVCSRKTQRACTRYVCVQSNLAKRSRGTNGTVDFITAWLKLDSPSCQDGGKCMSVGEYKSSLYGCQERTCVAVSPGLPKLVTMETGCSLEPHGDGCLGLDQTSAFFPLTSNMCVKYACVQEPVDKPWTVQAVRYPAFYGCYYEGGCHPEGVIEALPDCVRRMCHVTGNTTSISLTAGCSTSVGEATCRDPGEEWKVEDVKCVCRERDLKVHCATVSTSTTTPTSTTTTITTTTTHFSTFADIFSTRSQVATTASAPVSTTTD